MKRILRSRSLRRVATAIVATAVVGASLAACSSGSSSSGGSGSDVDAALKAGGEITYWSWTPSAEAQVAAFEKEYPKVKVKLVNAGTNTTEYTKLQNAIKAGSGAPDVAQVEYYAIPQFALSDSLVDLTQFGFDKLKSDSTTRRSSTSTASPCRPPGTSTRPQRRSCTPRTRTPTSPATRVTPASPPA
jgi:multiple sugar transport system substrate-binding protein